MIVGPGSTPDVALRTGVWTVGGGTEARSGCSVIAARLGANINRHANMIAAVGFTPDIARDTGIRTIGMIYRIDAGGGGCVIGCSLAARGRVNTHMIARECIAPDVSLSAGIWPVSCCTKP